MQWNISSVVDNYHSNRALQERRSTCMCWLIPNSHFRSMTTVYMYVCCDIHVLTVRSSQKHSHTPPTPPPQRTVLPQLPVARIPRSTYALPQSPRLIRSPLRLHSCPRLHRYMSTSCMLPNRFHSNKFSRRSSMYSTVCKHNYNYCIAFGLVSHICLI